MNTPLEDQLRAGFTKRPVLVNLQRPTTTVADLFSNDYLSLSADPRLRANVLDRLSHEQNILGSCGSRLLDGNTKTHVSMETRLRDYYDSPAALIFNSGYDANLALFGALPQRGDAIVYDELLHASAVDGMRASRAAKSLYPFKHNSVTSLKAVLQDVITSHRVGSGSSTVFVAFETVYSMDGDVAPVLDIVEAVEQTIPEGCSKIAIDEAHSTGLYGPGGRGLISHLGLEKRVALRLHTFSKAMAGVGAVVLCSELIRMYLINFARPFIYTTSLSPVSLIATELSFDIVEGEIGDQLRERLFALHVYAITLFRKELSSIPSDIIRLPPPAPTGGASLVSPMIPILTPHAVWLCLRLQRKGWAAVPVTTPHVPKGEERIRLVIHAGNTERELQEFISALLACFREGDWKKEAVASSVVIDGDVQTKPVARL